MVKQSSSPPPSLGFWGTTAIGLGGMIGGSIFAILGIVAALARGATPIAFIFAGIIALLTCYSYARLSIVYPSIGGTVRFLHEAFGFNLGTGSLNLLLCGSYIILLAVYAHAFGNYGLRLLPDTHHPVFFKHLIMTTLILGLTALNAFSPQLVVKSELTADFIKLSLLLIFVLAGLWTIRWERFATTTWPPLFEVLSGGMIIFMSFEGFELIANTSKDVKNPKKNLPKAFFTSVLLVIALYFLISLVVVGNLSVADIERNSGSALAESARPFLGQFGFVMTAFAALFAAGSAINAALYGASRISFIVAERGQLPHRINRLIRGRPIGGLLWISSLTIILANFFNLNLLSIIASVGFLIVFASVNLANYKLRKKTNSRAWVSLLGTSFCTIATLLLCYSTGKSSPRNLGALLLWCLLMIVLEALYLRYSHRKSRVSLSQVEKKLSQ